jgi:hypothetical protein
MRLAINFKKRIESNLNKGRGSRKWEDRMLFRMSNISDFKLTSVKS